MSFVKIRHKNNKSLTSLTIGKPFLNFSQDDIQVPKKLYEVSENPKIFNHEKCSLIIKHLEETIKDKTAKCQNLQNEKHDISMKFNQTVKILTKERELFEAYKEECLPNSAWKTKFADLKSKYEKQLGDLNQIIENLEKRLKDFERYNLNSKKKIEMLKKELEAKERHIAIILNEKEEINEKFDLSSILTCRHMHLLKQLFSKVSATTLNLEYMNLENSFIPVLSRVIELNPQIESVSVEGNFIDDEGILLFSEFIPNCLSNLNYINFSLNKISSKGAWSLFSSLVARENNTGKTIKKLVLSHNCFDQHDLFFKVFEELKPIRKNYPIVKLSKNEIKLARGTQLNKLFHLLCDKMFDNKLVKQLTVLLDKTEVEHKSIQDIEKLIIRNKSQVFQKFSQEQKESEFKSKILRLSTKHHKAKQNSENDIDITLIMAQRPTFAMSYIKKLIKEGLKINSIDAKLDETLLMYASRTNNMNLCKLLVSKNSGISIQNVICTQSKGLNAFLIACNYDNFEIADLLMLSGAKLDSVDNKGANAIHYAIKETKSRKIQRLVEMGVSVNWVDYKKKTPLHYAAKSGDSLMAELLVKLGADPNLLDYKGRSPAALAEDKGKTYFWKTLASLGGKRIRMVMGKEELKVSLGDKGGRTLEGLVRSVGETVENTKKLFRDLEKTNNMLDSAKAFILNKSIS